VLDASSWLPGPRVDLRLFIHAPVPVVLLHLSFLFLLHECLMGDLLLALILAILVGIGVVIRVDIEAIFILSLEH
jgi:hypothetical protein